VVSREKSPSLPLRPLAGWWTGGRAFCPFRFTHPLSSASLIALDTIPTGRYGDGMKDQTPHQSKTKLLSAALSVIRAKGYAATTVDDLCHAAGVTKGSFFHHFKSKDELAMSAAAYFGETTEGFFTSAPYHNLKDPLERLLGYLDFRAEGLRGDLPDYTCLFGTLVQETYATHPDIRTACDLGMSRHIEILTRDVEAAKQLYAPDAPWSAASVGYFIQSVLQGAFIFAKAKQSPEVARESLAHLRRYLATIFNQPNDKNERKHHEYG
jgi:TetR/AcrR family transcriptional repressor of nem operon